MTDLVVEIIDDTPPEDQNKAPLPPVPEDSGASSGSEELTSEAVQKRINELTRRQHDERRAKEAAARERDAAVRHLEAMRAENERLQQVLEAGKKAYAGVAEDSINSKQAQAEAILRQARESGDTESEIRAQRLISEAAKEAARLEVYRSTVQQPVPAQPQAAQYSQPPAQVAPDPKLEAWLSRNAWFNQDVGATNFAMGVHQQLVGNGVSPSSEEYYEGVDSAMKRFFDMQKPASPAASPVAPVTRVAPGVPRKVTLTRSQVDLCRKLRITPEQYASEALKMGIL